MGLACSILHTLVSGALMPKLNGVQNNNSEDLSAFFGLQSGSRLDKDLLLLFSGHSQEAG